MTPQEAVDKFLKTDMRGVTKGGLRLLFESVASAAKTKETRRCAARVKVACAAIPGCYTVLDLGATIASLGESLANDLLTTGGLEAVE